MKQALADEETERRLRELVDMVRKWNATVRLVSARELDVLWTRHVLDSLQLARWVPSGPEGIADFGSGAGFPGLVLASALPERSVTLVESDRRKAAFLVEAKRQLGLANVMVLARRVEELGEARFGVVTARAFAPLDRLLALAHDRLDVGGTLLALKGADHAREMGEARQRWCFQARVEESATHSLGRVLVLSGIAPRSALH